LAVSHEQSGRLHLDLKNLDHAVEEYRQALALRQQCADAVPKDIASQQALASARGKMAGLLGIHAEALLREKDAQTLRKAVTVICERCSILQRLADDVPSDLNLVRDLGHACGQLASGQHRLGDLPAAVKAARQSVALYQDRWKAD